MALESLRHSIIQNYLKNKELDHFYITIFIMNFGISLISLFVPIYLYKLGYSLTFVIFYYFLWALYYLIFLLPGAKAVSKIGAKHSILLSTFFLIIYYFGLNFLENFNWLFFVLPIFNSFYSILYWNAYHLLFFLNADKKKRGKEISFIYILTFVSMALAPFIGGLIATETIHVLFYVGSAIILLSSVPLFFTKENYCVKDFTFRSLYRYAVSKKEKKDVISFSGYAIEHIVQRIIWPVFLIMILGTYFKTGLLVSLVSFISLTGMYVSGKLSDKYDKVRMIKVLGALNAIGWFLRLFANSFSRIFFIDSYKTVSEKFLHVPWTAQLYALADRRHYFKFIIFQHFIYQSARVILLPVIMLIFYLNYHPFKITFVLAGILSLFYGLINRK